jgi:PhnB protein
MRFIPYLSFDGRCREAFEFYAKTFDGRIVDMISYGDTPAAEHVSKDWRHKIMNAYLMVGDKELMGSDPPPEMGGSEMQGMSVAIQIDDEARAERIFNALADGGTVTMPFEPTFWAKRFGIVRDRFGTPWLINCGTVRQGD